MAKEICISTTPHETRLAILEDDQLAEIYYERENEYTLAGSIYKGSVTRVLPGMQSSFVDVGLERDAFLYVTDFLEEQEDSEDYETASGSGQARKQAEDAPAAAASPVSDERRPRREGRGRGEGRRSERAEAAEAVPMVSPVREERPPIVAAFKRAEPTEADREEKGDTEAPEGTRRWRGRRGRRRGGMRAGVLGAAASATEGGEDALAATQTAAAPFSMPEHGAPGGMAAPLRSPEPQIPDTAQRDPETIHLQASAASYERSVEPEQPLPGRREPTAAVLPGESLSKYGGVPASSEQAKTATSSQPLRPANYTAFRPATQVEALEGWDGGSVLPGESLRRYKAAAPSAPSQVTADVIQPTQLQPTQVRSDQVGLDQVVAESAAVDSAVVAETATPQATHSQSGTEAPAEGGLDQIAAESAPTDADVDLTQGESVEQASAASIIETQPTVSFKEELRTDLDAVVEKALSSPTSASPETVAEALPGTEAAEQVTTSAEPVAHGEQTERAIGESEYEPTEGEASVRTAPGTSELRLSQLFGGSETPARLAGEAATEPTEQLADADTAAEAEAALPAELHSFSAADEGARTTLNAGSEAPYFGDAEPDTEHNALNELDKQIESEIAGERIGQSSAEPSAQPLEARLEELARFRESEAASFADAPEEPLEAEYELSGDAARADGFTELVDQLQGFAPGAGLLEEEVIDEDEYDFDPIHAHADEHDLEDLEEETLDGEGFIDPGSGAEQDNTPLRMEDAVVERQEATFTYEGGMGEDAEEDEEESAAAFALEEVDDEEEGTPTSTTVGEPQRRERTGEERGRRGGRNGRRRSAGGTGGGGGRRQSTQTQDLPIISDLLKQGQEILVQIAKEPIAKKGARITSHIALPGRFLVFMPTVSHVGVSRKIDSDEERLRLKRILISEKGDSSGGFIVRTAAEGASEEELRADLRFLISLWTEIRQRAETAKAPALIYHDLNLVERILRDQVSSNFSTIWVDTEQEYERIVRFLNRFQPALVRRVKLYTKETPLFEHFGIQEEISKALKSKVWLKSGGSIVINQTEALVAIDINTGKYVGKTARLEDTIVRTNLDAIPEIVRQIRLRDLGGIIVIDFIDMDERKNRHRVLAALEEAMKVDRAPSKVLQFNDFGLVAITRKRVKQSLERTLSVTCDTCAGTGMVKSPITVCNEIYIELRKMMKHLDGKDVMLRVNPEVVKQLKGGNGRWITEYEEMVGKTIIIKSDPGLHPEQFDIH